MKFIKDLIGTIWNVIAHVMAFIVELIIKFIHLFI